MNQRNKQRHVNSPCVVGCLVTVIREGQASGGRAVASSAVGTDRISYNHAPVIQPDSEQFSGQQPSRNSRCRMTWTSGCLSTRRDRQRIGKKLHVLLDTAIQQQRRSASDASDAAADDKKSRTVCSSQARRQAPPLEGRRRAGVTSIDRSRASRRPLSVAISRARAARDSVAWWQARALSHSKSKTRYHGLVTAWWQEDEDWLTDWRTDDRLIDWLRSAPLQVTTVIALWLEWDLKKKIIF